MRFIKYIKHLIDNQCAKSWSIYYLTGYVKLDFRKYFPWNMIPWSMCLLEVVNSTEHISSIMLHPIRLWFYHYNPTCNSVSVENCLSFHMNFQEYCFSTNSRYMDLKVAIHRQRGISESAPGRFSCTGSDKLLESLSTLPFRDTLNPSSILYIPLHCLWGA